MAPGSTDERTIMLMAELENGDGYVYATVDAQRAINQYEKWSVKFGADRVKANEGFDQLARPLMAIQDPGPSGRQ